MRTIVHKGRLTLCKRYRSANELEANLQEFWKGVPKEERRQGYENTEQISEYGLEANGYIIIDETCIYKIEFDKEYTMFGDFAVVFEIQPGVYKFVTRSCSNSPRLPEIIQWGFDGIKETGLKWGES